MAEKEYIEREAVNALIKAECSPKVAAYLIDAVATVPAADARHVVLCRDCKYFSEVMYGGTQFEYGYCDRWADGTRMNPDDFCSHAAKKEE